MGLCPFHSRLAPGVGPGPVLSPLTPDPLVGRTVLSASAPWVGQADTRGGTVRAKSSEAHSRCEAFSWWADPHLQPPAQNQGRELVPTRERQSSVRAYTLVLFVLLDSRPHCPLPASATASHPRPKDGRHRGTQLPNYGPPHRREGGQTSAPGPHGGNGSLASPGRKGLGGPAAPQATRGG